MRKNAYIVIKGRPCKVVDVSTSKTGKHGHAKCAFVGERERTHHPLPPTPLPVPPLAACEDKAAYSGSMLSLR